VCPAAAAAGSSTSPDASERAYTALTTARYGVPSGRYTVIRDPTCTPIAPGAASIELTAICPGRSSERPPEVTPRSRTRSSGPPATASPETCSRSGSVAATLTGATPAAVRTPGRARTCRSAPGPSPVPEITRSAVTVLPACTEVACAIDASAK
jgi:hypothetical protein